MRGDGAIEAIRLPIEIQDASTTVYSGSVAPRTAERIELAPIAVILSTGFFGASLSAREAIALGDALITAAHHYIAQSHKLFEAASQVDGSGA